MNFISLPKSSRKILFVAIPLLASLQLTLASEADQQKLVAANNAFTFDLTAQIAKGQPDANVFISPFSVSSALQMVANGAAGQTKAEMQQVLHTADLTSTIANPAFKDLNQQLASRKDVTLNLANGIWFKQGFHLKPVFVADNKNFFKAEMAAVDFGSPNSAQTINKWADKQTQGKIKDVVQYPFDPMTQVILANAIYFKGKWVKPFDGHMTQPRNFYLSDGEQKNAPMMLQQGDFKYQETPDFQAVQLPYEGGLQMQVFLPTKNSSPQKLIESFRASGNWQTNIQSGFNLRKGTLLLPKFKMAYDVKLNYPLEVLGMKSAFIYGKADFSAMAEEALFIGLVEQKSYVDVDEKGTEAAAVTTVTMMKSAMPRQDFRMIVDRPFLFVISDDATDSILFIGIVNDPTATGAN